LIEFAGPEEGLIITKAWNKGRVEKWYVHTSRHGVTSVRLLDKDAKFLPTSNSKLLGE